MIFFPHFTDFFVLASKCKRLYARDMADFTFRISPNIMLGSYSTSRLGEFALQYGKRFMLVLDPILKDVKSHEKVLQSLKDRGIDFFVFEELGEGATTKSIQQALNLARQSHIQGIIGVGGGRAINVARTIAAIYNESDEVYAFVEGKPVSAQPLPLICLPTTTRDPFVFTDTVPVTDSRASQIKLIKAQNGLCKLALFDPNMTATLSANQVESMTIESMCLATEAYLSQKANFFSDMIAEKAVEILGYATDENRSLTIATPTEELLSEGGCMASLASATSSIGVASLLALCINARYKTNRSLAAAILFPYIIEDCAQFKSDRVAKLTHLLNTAAENASPEECAKAFADNIRQRLAKANLPARLKDLNISIEQLALAAEDAGKLDYINSLPRSMTSDDLFSLIKLAY